MKKREYITRMLVTVVITVILFFSSTYGKAMGNPHENLLPAEGDRYKTEGDSFFQAGENARAMERYERALLIYRKTDSASGQGDIYCAIGNIHLRSGNNAKAKEMYEKALPFFRKARSLRGEGTVYTGIGNLHLRSRDYEGAGKMYGKALILFGKANALADQGRVYRNLGEIAMRRGNNAAAMENYEKALSLISQAGDAIGRGSALRSLGDAHYYVGNNEKAMGHYHLALSIFQEKRFPHGEADVFRRMGQIHLRTGDNEKALELLRDNALPRYRKVDEPVGQADVYKDIGDIYYYSRDYAKALEMYDNALPLYRKVDDPIGIGNVFRSMGDISMRTGDNKRAVAFYTRAREFYQRADSPIGQGNVYHSLGDIYLMTGEPERAREMYRQALPFYEKANALMGQGNSYRGLGDVSFGKGDYPDASKMYHLALPFYLRSNSAYGQGRTYQNLGDIQFAGGKPEKAIEMYDQAANIYRRMEDIELEAYALFRKVAVFRKEGRRDEALSLYEAGLAKLEKVRKQTLFSEMKKGYLEKVYDYYEDAAVFMLDNRYYEKAFKTIEAMKARAFLDLLSEGRVDLRKGIDPELQKKRDNMESTLSLLLKHIREEAQKPVPDETKITALRNDYARGEEKLESVKREIRFRNPLYSSVRYPEPINLQELRENILKKNESLIEYFIAKQGVYCFVIDKDRYHVLKLPVATDVLEKKVGSFLKNIQDATRGKTFDRPAAARLYDDLIRPLVPLLKEKTLIIAPHGIIALLPFEALTAGAGGEEAYLIGKYRIKYIQSASILGMLRTHYKKESINDRFLGFGDPVYDYANYRAGKPETGEEEVSDRSASGKWIKNGYLRSGGRLNRLVGSGQEIKEIGAIFQNKTLPEKVLLRTDAREENAKSRQMQDYGYIHFSTHGILAPDFQAIALSHIPQSSEDGFLTLGEIMNSRFNAHLVVLSACETGLGQIERGEGVTGLTRAVMYAGSPAAVVSLWSVSDEGTKELMVRFYKNLIQKEMGKEEALRLAKMEMIGGKDYSGPSGREAMRGVKITGGAQGGSFSHPFFWSAFVMYGE